MSDFKYLTGKLINKGFGNSTDHSGETEGYCDFEFKLKQPIRISYGGRSYMYDRIKFVMQTWSSPLYFAGPGKVYAEMPVPLSMIKEIYTILTNLETGKGALKDWCFSDEIYEMMKKKEES